MTPQNARELLERALQCEIEERMYAFSLEQATSSHVFSKRFEKKMKPLLKQAERPKAIRLFVDGARRVAMIALVATILTMTTVLSVEALRTRFFAMVAERFQQYTAIYFEPTVPVEDGAFLDQVFIASVPTYIPDGFMLVLSSFDECVMLEYDNGAGGNFSYDQNYLSGIGMHLNTEGVELEEIEINDFPGYYYSNVGMQSFLWYDDTFLYSICTTLPKYEAEKIAKSVKLKK